MRRALALAVCLAGFGAFAQDYLRTSVITSAGKTVCPTWDRRDFTYNVGIAGSARTPGDTEFAAVDAAFATWQAVSNVCSDFTFTAGARLSAPTTGQGSETTRAIVFREEDCATAVPPTAPCLADGSCADAFGCWDGAAGTIAITNVRYSTRTGIAVDADIEFNARGFLFTTVPSPPCDEQNQLVTCAATDIQNTLTHEIGHAVGFDHVPGADSTMNPEAVIGETRKRSIDIGTQAGFCTTYPRGQPPVPCDELGHLNRKIIARNTGTLGIHCAEVAPGAAGTGLPLLLLALRRRRRR